MSERTISRRSLLVRSGGLLAVMTVGGVCVPLSEAMDAGVPYQVLDEVEVKTLRSLADTLVPGAADAGVVHFIDSQLDADPNDSLLVLKYFQIMPPYASFYREGLKALNNFAASEMGKQFYQLDEENRTALITKLITAPPQNWSGPPAFLFYMVVRNDAVDVMYGTPEGFERLEIPYMEHILPPKGWRVND